MTEIQRAKHEVSMRFWKEVIMNPHPAQPEQDTKAEPLPAKHMDIVPFAEALDMAKVEPGVAALPAVPSITIHCGKMDIDIRDGTSPELLRMVMSLAGEEATLC